MPATTSHDTGRRVLFSAQKNEGPFLLEWVAYHKVIGFTDIVIVSNDCDDGSDDLLDALMDTGEITHLRQNVPSGVPPQKNAARIFEGSGFLQDGDWVMWLDTDEFLLPSTSEGTVSSLVEEAKSHGAEAMMVAWRFFGDGGNAKWPGRHISRHFTKAQKRWRGRNAQVKTLFRYSDQIEALDIHRPIVAQTADETSFPVITSAGQKADSAFFDRSRKNPYNRMADANRPYRLASVAHFSIRTPDMFALKTARGDGYFAVGADPVLRNQSFYDAKNKNEAEETGLLAHETATVAKMSELMSRTEVRSATSAIRGFIFPEYEAKKASLEMPVQYWQREKNFGDLLSPLILGRVADLRINEKDFRSQEYVLAVGSIIQTISRPGAHIWGAGLLRPLEARWARRLADNPPAKVHAVRGKLTRRELVDHLDWDVPETYGDPALLLPRVVPLENMSGSGKIAVCPHLNHRQKFKDFSDPRVELVDVAQDPIAVVRRLAMADVVVSSSLHGLIVAQAYGVPWVWMAFEGAPLDKSEFKFHDFFSTLDADRISAHYLPDQVVNSNSLARIADHAEHYNLAIDLDALAASVPRQPNPASLESHLSDGN